MKPRSFNSIMHYVNEEWAAKVLNMHCNPSPGPDLIDDNKIVECKFKLIYVGKYTHVSWRVLGYQMDYEKMGKSAYWALGTYSLSKPVSSINSTNPRLLEKLVCERSLTLVNWDWMKQFAKYHHYGKTEFSEWDHDMIFPKKRLLPKVNREYKLPNAVIYLTEGVDPGVFKINSI